MKNILLFALVLMIAATNVLAQTEKGNWLPGLGVASANGAFNENNSSASISIYPSAGYFIKDNLAIGANVQVGFGANNGYSYLNYGLHPFVRPYFSKMDARTKLFAEAMLGVSGSTIFGDVSSPDKSHLDIQAAVRGGIGYFLSPDVSLETTLGVTAWGWENNVLLMPSIGIGFRAYINRKVNCWTKN